MYSQNHDKTFYSRERLLLRKQRVTTHQATSHVIAVLGYFILGQPFTNCKQAITGSPATLQ